MRAKRRRKRPLALALLVATLPAGRAGAETAAVFPRSGELFARLLADPRETRLATGYYRLKGQDTADVYLGHSWGVARWAAAGAGAWRLQWDIDAMAVSRFKLGGSINEFQTVDFFAALPLEIQRGAASGRFSLFHQSSHLGDDYIRRTGDSGFRYSIEGVKGTLSYDVTRWLRAYVDGTFLLHTIPSPRRGALGFGAELDSPPFARLNKNMPLTAYLSWDLQSHARVQWNLDSSAQLGLRLRFRSEARSMRLFWEYFDGHSPYGEFFAVREHYSELGVAFDF